VIAATAVVIAVAAVVVAATAVVIAATAVVIAVAAVVVAATAVVVAATAVVIADRVYTAAVTQRLHNTGAFSAFSFETRSRAGVDPNRGADLVVKLHEKSLSGKTEVTRSSAGVVEFTGEVGVSNVFGSAETISARMTQSRNNVEEASSGSLSPPSPSPLSHASPRDLLSLALLSWSVLLCVGVAAVMIPNTFHTLL
jgi:hypothetical protein